jgi:hypothetical protein
MIHHLRDMGGYGETATANMGSGVWGSLYSPNVIRAGGCPGHQSFKIRPKALSRHGRPTLSDYRKKDFPVSILTVQYFHDAQYNMTNNR